MELIYILSTVTLILTSIYYYLKYNFWKKQGVPCADGIIPGLGNIGSVVFLRESFAKLCEDFYNGNKNHSMFGFYQLTTPTLLIRDPELVKNVLVTNFSSFDENHAYIICPKKDTLLSINPFFSTMETWKEDRAPLSNAFSSKKLRLMLPLITNVSSKMEKYVKQKISLQNGKAEFELKKFFNLYTGETAAAGIGIEGQYFEEENKPSTNEWTHKRIIEIMFENPTFTGGFGQLLMKFMPRLARLFNYSLISNEVDSFFRHCVKNITSARRSENTISNNFLQIVEEYIKANGTRYDKETVLASHMLLFSMEIYETSAITMSFLCFQLALHSEIQEKVREEIKNVLQKYNGKLDYEALKELPYLDQVLNESLRLNHVGGTLMKRCTKETQLVGSDGLSCKLKAGNIVVISTYGLQMDPKYWPDPENFDPNRFNEKYNNGRHKFCFIPFGEGPRICVGMRIANILMKVGIITILKNYSLEISPKTSLPLKKDQSMGLTINEGGLWAFLRPLKNSVEVK